MSLRHSYTLIAPFYDALVAPFTRTARRASLDLLGDTQGCTVLLCGIGTGLDIPHLPRGARYLGLDLTPAMLKAARRRAAVHGLDLHLQVGDAAALPYRDGCFDAVVMHLILAVVPEPGRALTEAARVLKPGGRLLVFDKFLRPGQRAPLRRLINPLAARLATSTTVVFEELLDRCPALRVQRERPALARGWFRSILLEKTAQPIGR